MPQYYAIERFIDLKDENVVYEPRTLYPREGVDVSDYRIKQLSSRHNAFGRPVIARLNELPPKEVVEDKKLPEEVSEEKEVEKKTPAKKG